MGSCCSVSGRDENLDETQLPTRHKAAQAGTDGPISSTTCAICQAIRWDRLPSEEEPGQAHQPSLAALERSARTCILCDLLLNAVTDMRSDIIPARISAATAYPLQSGGFCTEVMHYGPESPALDYDMRGDTSARFYEDQVSARLTHGSCPQGLLRPFLFGSWWKLKGSDTADQLIGLGVRLGTTPLIEDAEGNERRHIDGDGNVEPHIVYRGTFIRLRTGDGRFIDVGTALILTSS